MTCGGVRLELRDADETVTGTVPTVTGITRDGTGPWLAPGARLQRELGRVVMGTVAGRGRRPNNVLDFGFLGPLRATIVRTARRRHAGGHRIP